MTSRRGDSDERGHGIADASASLPAIEQLAELAQSQEWVAEDPETHLLPGFRDRVDISGLSMESAQVQPDGSFSVRLVSSTKQSRREIRQSVWAILGGIAELTALVRETQNGNSTIFDVVTGIPPGGTFATHGHTLRIEVE